MCRVKQQETEEALALTQMLDTINFTLIYFTVYFSQQDELKDGYNKMEKELLWYVFKE